MNNIDRIIKLRSALRFALPYNPEPVAGYLRDALRETKVRKLRGGRSPRKV